MNFYTEITISDKKNLIKERVKNNENALYHLSIALKESETNGISEDEILSINKEIFKCSSNIIVLNNIMNNLNNGIDEFSQY